MTAARHLSTSYVSERITEEPEPLDEDSTVAENDEEIGQADLTSKLDRKILAYNF